MKKFLLILLMVMLTSFCHAEITFDNTDDYLYLSGTESDFDVGNSGSVSMCAKVRRASASVGQTIVAKRDDSDTGNGETSNWHFLLNDDDTMGFFYSKNSGTHGCLSTVGIMNDTNSHIICSTHNFSGDQTDCDPGQTIYVDGTSIGVQNWFGTVGHPDRTNELVYVGSIFDSAGTDGAEVWNGDLGWVAVWIGRVITEAEHDIMYQSDNMLIALQFPTNLMGLWLLNENPDGVSADGITFYDYSGNGNNMIGDKGGNTTGLTSKAENDSTYP